MSYHAYARSGTRFAEAIHLLSELSMGERVGSPRDPAGPIERSDMDGNDTAPQKDEDERTQRRLTESVGVRLEPSQKQSPWSSLKRLLRIG